MPSPTKPNATKPPALPPIILGKFETLLSLTETVLEENRAQLTEKMRTFADEHHDATRRPLTADEAVQAAAIMRDIVKEDVLDPAELQNGDLYAWDRPQPMELLVAAGLSTASTLVDALKQFVVVVESDTDEFLGALDGDLQEWLDEQTTALSTVALSEVRQRTEAALNHFAAEAGYASAGKALRPIVATAMRALTEAAATVTREIQTGSPSSTSTS